MILGKRITINDILIKRNCIETVAQWIGAGNVMRNQKIMEFNNNGYGSINKAYAPIKRQFDFLNPIPVQILRNSASDVADDANAFLKGLCKPPRIKPRHRKRSVKLTKELFSVKEIEKGQTRISVYSNAKKDKKELFSVAVNIPAENINNQLILSRERDRFTLSFSYDDGQKQPSNDQLLDELAYLSEGELDSLAIGLDGGAKVNAYLSNGQAIAYSIEQRDKLKKLQEKVKKKQRYLAKQRKRNEKRVWREAKKKKLKKRKAIKAFIKENNTSNQQQKTKKGIAKCHQKTKHIRTNFNHHLSKDIVKLTPKLFIYEGLDLKNMTKKAKPKLGEDGKTYVKNNKKQKSGLNKAILNVALGQLKQFTLYKLNQAGKAHLPVPAPYTSQQCFDCKSMDTKRIKQSLLICNACGKKHQADHNASLNIKHNGIQQLLTQPQPAKAKKSRVIRRNKNKSDEGEALTDSKKRE